MGENEFKVQVFNLTTCSVQYLDTDEKKKGQQEEEDGEDCQYFESDQSGPELSRRSRKRVAKRRRKTSLPNQKGASSSSGFESESSKVHDAPQLGETKSNQLVKLVKSRGICTSAKFPSTLQKMYKQCRNGIEAALQLTNPKTPCFIAIMSMRQARDRVMTPTIPASFVWNHIRGEWKSVTLMNREQQKRWDVVTEKKNGLGGMLMGYGWNFFSKDNSLTSADVCLFQLVSAQERLFRVSVFRASDADADAAL
ncbi:B3 domain-containing protein Os03g0620400 [Linum grandiflorum]